MALMEHDMNKIREEALKELARRNYIDYFYYANNCTFVPLRHQRYIAPYLQRISDGERLFIIVELPPQHGKSTFITESFPSYYLMKNPDKLAMVVSYSEELYKKFGRKNREKFRTFSKELFDLEISSDTASVSEWGIDKHLGQLYSTSILGGATGRGSNLLIIDDPIKNRAEAESKTIRDKIYSEWQDTFYSRLSADGSVIVIMTRWHEDDLAGRLLKENKLPWIEIKIPAVAEENDLLNREIGESLAPEIGKDEEWARQTKEVTGSRGWAALYQQRPTPAGGDIFKRSWAKFYVPTLEMKVKLGLGDDVKVMPSHFDIQMQSWDCTFKDKNTSDFVSGQVWARAGVENYLLDRHHERMGIVDTMKAIEVMTAKHPEAIGKLIEDKANGSAVIEMLKKKIKGIVPVNPQGGKEVRAQAVCPLWEAGNVYLPHPLWKSYSDEILDELTAFPNGAHDDDVDSMTQALVRLDKRPVHTRRENRTTAF
ncbi:phage terminase large subunit [Lactococcus lactis]|uniref:phage terminase large subunit n=1 Tax=Lactococcus lactis TaxID=1358 RepID=UPI0025A19171|nr:phage terminase large subunit [Lactococcus lactis]MDM7659498.1 phage terminase large subunit [Lactococcus lactis]